MPQLKKRMDRLELINRCLRSGWYSYNSLKELLEEELLEDVTIRTLQNDFNELRSAAEDNTDPIASRSLGNNKEFRYKDKHYSYIEPLVSEHQIMILQEAVAILNKYKGVELAEEVVSVIAYLQKRNFEKIDFSSAYFQPDNYENYAGHKYLLDLLECCRNQTVIELTYKPFGKDTLKAIFHPALLKEWRGRWFIVGRVDTYTNHSTFALDRISSIKLSKEPYQYQDIDNLISKFKNIIGVTLNSGDIESIVFNLTSIRAQYLITKPIHHSQKILSINNNNTYTFSIDVIPNKELYTFFLEYGSDLEILEPMHVRHEIANIVKKIYDKYQ